MSNIVGYGNRAAVSLVLKVVSWQVGSASLVGLLFWIFGSAAAALAGFCGGMIAAIGSGIFGWRMFAPGVAPASRLQRAMFAGESLKWFWYVLAIWAAFARFKLMPLPLLVGLVAAQFGYWIGLVGMQRGQVNGGD